MEGCREDGGVVMDAVELTSSQLEALKKLYLNAFTFPGKSRKSCEVLERLGLADSDVLLEKKNYATGEVVFSRAYRLTPEGLAFLKKQKVNP